MIEITNQQKNEIKYLLFAGLDFMKNNFNGVTLKQFIEINKAVLTQETEVITPEEFEEMIEEYKQNHFFDNF